MKKIPRPTLDFEIQSGFPAHCVVGVDEVGRGCLAGPVVAAAVVLPSSVSMDVTQSEYSWILEITDSKLLSEPNRNRLAPLIQNWVTGWALGTASVEEIDEINIFHASHLAMKRAVLELQRKNDLLIHHILVDGNFVPKNLPVGASAIVKGDQKSLSIASAALIAKVWRDQEMKRLDAIYPGYGLASHKGYSTPMHQKALKELGATSIHRRSFAPVAEALGLRSSKNAQGTLL